MYIYDIMSTKYTVLNTSLYPNVIHMDNSLYLYGTYRACVPAALASTSLLITLA